MTSDGPLDFASLFAPGKKPPDRAFWLTRIPQERLAAAEYLRQKEYGYDATTAQLEREVRDVSHWVERSKDSSGPDKK